VLDPPPGTRVAGKYEIKRRLGRGGFGAVYEAVHVEIGRRVAIKTIDLAHAGSIERVTRFRREARAAGQIESPHIVHVFDIGEDPELGLYMVMELLTGEDLASKLERVGKLPVAHAVAFAHQAAIGLAKAHAAGVVHRDLKPANMFLVTREEQTQATVKIVDFGVSKLAADARSPGDGEAITRAGITMGTPQYMSPEQVRGGDVDKRTDVWALGAVLYEMLAGKPAYPLLESYERTFISIALGKPPPLAKVAPWVPPGIIAAVEDAMEHDLDLRCPDCDLFADALVDAMPEAFPESSRRRRSTTPRKKRPRAEPPAADEAPIPLVHVVPRRRQKMQMIVLGSIAMLVVGISIAILLNKPPQAPPNAASAEARTSTRPSQGVSVSASVSGSGSAGVTANASASASDVASGNAQPPPVAGAKSGIPVVHVAPPPTQFGAAGVSSNY
jgi:serine/threonine protein kinase